MKHEKMFQDKMKRTKRGVLAPVKLDRSPKKDPSRRKLTTWHPEDEDDFAIHPRRQTKWSPKRRKKPTAEQQNNKSKKNKYDTTKPLKGEDVHQHMSRTKTHTVNIFTSNARSLAWLEADAIVRRKYEEFSGASASLYAAENEWYSMLSDFSLHRMLGHDIENGLPIFVFVWPDDMNYSKFAIDF